MFYNDLNNDSDSFETEFPFGEMGNNESETSENSTESPNMPAFDVNVVVFFVTQLEKKAQIAFPAI